MDVTITDIIEEHMVLLLYMMLQTVIHLQTLSDGYMK